MAATVPGFGPTAPTGSGDDEQPVAMLRRWAEFGAVWRVVARSDQQVTVSLCRCDDGEEVQRLTSRNPDLLAYLADRDGSDS
jgi:hypothetical protein